MKSLILVLALFTITSCQSMHSNDPDSIFFRIPKGSTLTLNKPLTIPSGKTHALIQYGKETSINERDSYDVNCRLDFKKFGPRTIEPERFTITRAEDTDRWISQPVILGFFTTMYLTSDKDTDVIDMLCLAFGDQNDYHFTVKDIETTLGDYFTLSYAENK